MRNAKLTANFFERDANQVAKELLGKVIRHYHQGICLSARIIETESYFLNEKASHSSLGYTQKRKALFMPAGTIYMYYAHGNDSLNLSCKGEGKAVLIKSGYPYFDGAADEDKMLAKMQSFHLKPTKGIRSKEKLCCGQTLLCKSLQLKVNDWNAKQFSQQFYFEDIHHRPAKIIQTTRLGIPCGRDQQLLQRFIDYDYVRYCTSNPLARRGWKVDIDYFLVSTN